MWPTHFSYNSHCVSYQHNKSSKCSWVANRTSSSPAAAWLPAGLPGCRARSSSAGEFTVQIMKSNIYCVLVCRAAASSLCVIRWSEAAAGRITSITRLLGTRTRLRYQLSQPETQWGAVMVHVSTTCRPECVLYISNTEMCHGAITVNVDWWFLWASRPSDHQIHVNNVNVK